MTPSGLKLMEELRVGAQVLDRNSEWTTVYSFQYKDWRQHPYVEIHIGLSAVIRMSTNHLVFRQGQDGDVEDVEAGQLRIGDTVFLHQSQGTVTKMIMVMDRGAYSPMTYSGTLIVDGVWVSCHGAGGHSLRDNRLSSFMTQTFMQNFFMASLRALAKAIDVSGVMEHDAVKGMLEPRIKGEATGISRCY